jgi:hypothetical protein
MGAFDGIKIPYDSGYSSAGFNNPYEYFPNQGAFKFFKGFGIEELKQLLVDAEARGSDMVWVPQEHRHTTGLRTWYVRALIKHHYGIEL